MGPVFHTGCLSSLGHHAFHSESLLGVVEAEEGGLAETQHAALRESHRFVDRQSVHAALVSTGVKCDDSSPVLNKAVLSCDPGALYADVHGSMTHSRLPFRQG